MCASTLKRFLFLPQTSKFRESAYLHVRPTNVRFFRAREHRKHVVESASQRAGIYESPN